MLQAPGVPWRANKIKKSYKKPGELYAFFKLKEWYIFT